MGTIRALSRVIRADRGRFMAGRGAGTVVDGLYEFTVVRAVGAMAAMMLYEP